MQMMQKNVGKLLRFVIVNLDLSMANVIFVSKCLFQI